MEALDTCSRCRRPVPPVDDPSYCYWNVEVDEAGEVTGMRCEGCMTGEDWAALHADLDEFMRSPEYLREQALWDQAEAWDRDRERGLAEDEG